MATGPSSNASATFEATVLVAEDWLDVLGPDGWTITGSTNVAEGQNATYTISFREAVAYGSTASVNLAATYGSASAADFSTSGLPADVTTAIRALVANRNDLTFDGTTLTYRPTYSINYSATGGAGFTSIAGTGTALNIANDANVLRAIGFSFNFYGTAYTQLYVSDNGYVTFGTGVNDGNNVTMAAGNVLGGRPTIAAYWDQLNPSLAGAVDVFVQTVGVAGSSRVHRAMERPARCRWHHRWHLPAAAVGSHRPSASAVPGRCLDRNDR